jgi:hypothetical protein
VTRFDYYGTGNSSGVLSDVTISTLERDIAGIVDMTRVDSLPLWLVAGRFGASLGLLAAGAGLEVDGLILWDPILNLSQEFRTRFVNKTLLTNKLMSDGPTSRVALDQIADTSGIVELSCLAFRSQFYRELSVFALGVCSGRRIPHALVLFTGSSAPAREIEILTSFVRGDGLMIRALNAANAARNWAAEGFSESQAATFLLQNTTEFVAGRNPALRTELWKNSFEFQT